MRRGQITLFILLGLLMIFALIFFFYMMGVETEAKTKVSIEKISESILSSTAIKYYVITCLDAAAEQSLRLAGLQSGYIYDFQAAGTARYFGPPVRDYGYHIVPFWYSPSGTYFDVAYGIYAPEFRLPSHPPPPLYPYEGSLQRNPPILNVFGNFKVSAPDTISSLPELCYKNGSNTFGIKGFEWSCESYSPNPKLTIQYYLEQFIANKTRECVNLSLLESKGYNVSAGTGINASVLFGENHVFVMLQYPIVIGVRGQTPFVKVLSYTSEQPVRFKKVYELASHMIRRDVRNIFFDFRNETLRYQLTDCPGLNITPGKTTRSLRNASCLYPGMSVTQYRDVCKSTTFYCPKGNYSDVILIKDDASAANQEPFIFEFAVENRYPVLDYIDESVLPNSSYYLYLNKTYRLVPSKVYSNIKSSPSPQNYNIVAEVGQRVQIFPMGLDPEEDKLNYTYSGWKTPVQIYDAMGANYSYDIDLGNGVTSHFVGPNVSGGEGYRNRWQDSNDYNSGYSTATPRYKDAEYPERFPLTLTKEDVGYHWIRINVTDPGGLYDLQDIKMQVRCKVDECCDSSTDYHYKAANAKCNDCRRCDAEGRCLAISSDGEGDCGVCSECRNGQCYNDNTYTDYGNRCVNSNGSNYGCCMGECVIKQIPAPWLNPDKCIECYETTLRCDSSTRKLVYPARPGAACGPGGTGRCDSNGRCVLNNNCYVAYLSDSYCDYQKCSGGLACCGGQCVDPNPPDSCQQFYCADDSPTFLKIADNKACSWGPYGAGICCAGYCSSITPINACYYNPYCDGASVQWSVYEVGTICEATPYGTKSCDASGNCV
jgi:hypothetical protein